LSLHQSLTVAAQPAISQNIDFTPVADIYRMRDLFHASAPAGQTIAGYRVALGDGGGILMKGTVDVTGQSTFTADEFAQLTYIARTGADTSELSQSLVVVAQTGTRQPNGTLTREIDSPAMQITVDITGIRSINAMNALSSVPSEADAATVSIVQQAGIFTGFVGTTRPTVQTDGNFTAIAGDIYRMSDLFKASAPTGQTIAGYRVALGASGGGAQLQLNGDPVIDGRTSFTAEEFAHLTYTTGDTGSQQSLMVIAQTGTRLPVPTDSPAGTLGALIHETDSQALQITANVTGSRSINAMNALTGTNVLDVSLTGADAAIAGIVQGAGIFNGFIGTARPSLQTDMTPEPPLSLSALADATGTYRSAGLSPANSDIDLLALYSTAIGSSVAPGVFSSSRGPLATALLLLGGTATGAFQTADNLNALAQAIRAYNTTKGF
jgi:hypothetical protein